MDKNISPDGKSNQLAELLNENMKKSDAKMNKTRVRLISIVILALCKVQTVSFHKLALVFDFAITATSKIDLQIRAGIHLKHPVEY